MKNKKFQYDVLLDRENICNLKREQARINQGIENGEKMVIYGRRNMGKTSLIKNAIIPDFRKKHPKSFVFFADLMQVKNMSSISSRLRISFEESFKDSFPAKALVDELKNYLKGINFNLSINPISGEPNFSITTGSGSTDVDFSIENIFRLINDNLLKKVPGLIILDEFQDISMIDEAEGIFRNALQKLGSTPVILMGSKKHILSKMFSNPAAPFADFGSDVEFHDIPYEEYHKYILERFKSSNLDISLDDSIYWQELLFRSPEPINIIGSYIVDNFKNRSIKKKEINQSLISVIRQRRARFEGILGNLTNSEEEIMIAIAKQNFVLYPAGKDFLSIVPLSNATVTNNIKSLYDRSLLEKTSKGYRISSPILHYYLKLNR
jgi:AAA+ ATPase superfamily predicted ATPase